MSTPSEETIKKLERRISNLEKQVQDILKTIKIMQERTNHPLSSGYDRCPVVKHPRR